MKNLFYRVISMFMCMTFLFTQVPALSIDKTNTKNNEFIEKLMQKTNNISYDFYDNYKISVVKHESLPKIWYFYNEKNQLIRENNAILQKTFTYSYDSRGNILNKKIYTFTDSSLEKQIPEKTLTYEYIDQDKLTCYDGQKLIYDKFGNPKKYYNGWNFEWSDNCQLSSVSKSGTNIEYFYDEKGQRTKKIINGETIEFDSINTGVLRQKSKNDLIYWYAPEENKLASFNHNDTDYIYIWNMQNDVIGIANQYGDILVNYTYDSWGKLISITDQNGNDITNEKSHIGYINPLRYRTYYYDNETKLYYLNSRYYDPETGRFISEDDKKYLKSVDVDVSNHNLYAYCLNDPVNMVDYDGRIAIILGGITFAAADLILIASGITLSSVFLNPHTKKAVNDAVAWAIRESIDTAGAILGKFKGIGEWVAGQIARLVTAYNIHMAKTKVPSKLKNGDKAKTPDTHPDEFTKDKGSSGYTHNDTGWKAAPHKGQQPHGGSHWDVSPPTAGKGHINVAPDGKIFGGKLF